MNASTLRLVLLVSCCHGLVHVYELSFASIEQLIAEDFGVDTAVTGSLGSCFRLPFGLFALGAGWAADRFGAKRLLLFYLLGCSGAALLVALSPGLAVLFVAMFTLGTFASIYHPAGVGLISRHTRAENRPMALGYHGIFGSLGIAAGPFLASLVLATGASWRQYCMVLVIPGVLLAGLMALRLGREPNGSSGAADSPAPPARDDAARWDCYFMLIASAMMAGFVYAAVMTFMPRYLVGAGVGLEAVQGNFLTGIVLLLGVLGQYTAGRFARPSTLEPMMACAFLGAVPCLVWMGFATGAMRVLAAAVFTPIFFMHQPLFNSLVAKYVPRRRRSLAYGLSFTAGFGLGGLGSAFAGNVESSLGNYYGPIVNYGVLAVVILLAGTLTLLLWRRHGSGAPLPDDRAEPFDGPEALL